MKIWQTLYKTEFPENEEHAEYYQPILLSQRRANSWAYFARETHAWWSEADKTFRNRVTTLNPEEGFSNYEEAQQEFTKQVSHRASEGFVHSFSLDFDESKGIIKVYRKLDKNGKVLSESRSIHRPAFPENQ
jgi:hypothetical protein